MHVTYKVNSGMKILGVHEWEIIYIFREDNREREREMIKGKQLSTEHLISTTIIDKQHVFYY